MVFSDIYPETSPFPLPLPLSLVSSSSLFHGLASPCAVDQRSIVGSDSMDDAEAAGVERRRRDCRCRIVPPTVAVNSKGNEVPPTGPIPTKKKPLGCALGKEIHHPPPRTSDISSGSVFSNGVATVYFAFLETLIFRVDHVRSIFVVVSLPFL